MDTRWRSGWRETGTDKTAVQPGWVVGFRRQRKPECSRNEGGQAGCRREPPVPPPQPGRYQYPANSRLRDTGRTVSPGRSVQRPCAQKPTRFIVHGGLFGVRSLCELRCPLFPGVRGWFAVGERYRDCEIPDESVNILGVVRQAGYDYRSGGVPGGA